jgi:hypothetical protein
MPTQWKLVLQFQPTRQSVGSLEEVHRKLHHNENHKSGLETLLLWCSKQSIEKPDNDNQK